jgi:SPFH domain / Band 7 family
MGSSTTIERTVPLVDLRERSLTVKGQEILTADKVAIRVSLPAYFKIVDAEAALHNVASYEERIYEDVQLAALGNPVLQVREDGLLRKEPLPNPVEGGEKPASVELANGARKSRSGIRHGSEADCF